MDRIMLFFAQCRAIVLSVVGGILGCILGVFADFFTSLCLFFVSILYYGFNGAFSGSIGGAAPSFYVAVWFFTHALWAFIPGGFIYGFFHVLDEELRNIRRNRRFRRRVP